MVRPCNTLLQIGSTWYSPNSLSVTQSLAVGQNSCSAEIEVESGGAIPTAPNLINVVTTTGVKLFGGYIASGGVSYKFNGSSRVCSISGQDFANVLTKLKVITYYNGGGMDLTLEDHILNLLSASGATGGGYSIDYLNYAVGEFPGGGGAGDPFQFEISGVYLQDALNQICQLQNFRWWVDYGDWTDISAISGALARLNLRHNTDTGNPAPYSIVIPSDAEAQVESGCGNSIKYWNIGYTQKTPECSAVIVAGENVDFAAGAVGLRNEPGYHDIPVNSHQAHFPLLEKCLLVDEVIMTINTV